MRSHNGPEPGTGPRRYWRSRSTSETDCPTEPPAYTEKRTASLAVEAEEGRDPVSTAQQWLRDADEGPLSGLRQLDAAMTGPVETITVRSLRDAVVRYLDTGENLD